MLLVHLLSALLILWHFSHAYQRSSHQHTVTNVSSCSVPMAMVQAMQQWKWSREWCDVNAYQKEEERPVDFCSAWQLSKSEGTTESFESSSWSTKDNDRFSLQVIRSRIQHSLACSYNQILECHSSTWYARAHNQNENTQSLVSTTIWMQVSWFQNELLKRTRNRTQTICIPQIWKLINVKVVNAE